MANKVSPIRPDEVAKEQSITFPDAVFESFNALILQNFVNGYATIKQEDVVTLMVDKGLVVNDIFKKGWLNVEEAYQQAGWKVKYDKPGYNESYPATFEFKRL